MYCFVVRITTEGEKREEINLVSVPNNTGNLATDLGTSQHARTQTHIFT